MPLVIAADKKVCVCLIFKSKFLYSVISAFLAGQFHFNILIGKKLLIYVTVFSRQVGNYPIEIVLGAFFEQAEVTKNIL